MDTRTLRKARQTLSTDRTMGMDFVPVMLRKPVEMTVVAAPHKTAEPPFRQAQGKRATGDKVAALAELERETCAWVEANWPRDGWRRVVFGEGDPDTPLMFIGEGPGSEEDSLGRPFVGPAGKLLDRQIAAMGLRREQVYIANIAKTRPPGNRVPTAEEADKWMPWLERQVEIIGPRVIVALGATSAKYLLNNPQLKITRDRGQWCSFRGIDLMCTFHPAYLLRSYTVDNRRRVWDDLQKVLERLGLPVPGKGIAS